MKRKSYKQKFQAGVGFESDSGEHSMPTPTVDFDFASVDPDENKVDADAGSHGLTRGEMEADLKRRGLSEDERAVGLLKAFEHMSLRKIAAEVGKSHTWVADILKRLHNRKPSATGAIGLSQAVQERRSPERREAERRQKEAKGEGELLMPETTLTDAMNHAHDVLSRWPWGDKVDAGHISFALEELGISATSNDEKQGHVALIAVKPEILLRPECRPFVETLVELLTAARYGKKAAAASARKTLTLLIRGRHGKRCPVPDRVLVTQSRAICVALYDLQKAWHEFSHDPIPSRLDGIREMIGSGNKIFSNVELLPLMTADLPTASARVAEKVTGIASESFLRVWNESHTMRWIFQQPARF